MLIKDSSIYVPHKLLVWKATADKYVTPLKRNDTQRLNDKIYYDVTNVNHKQKWKFMLVDVILDFPLDSNS